MERLAVMMTVQDVSRYLRVHAITVYRMIQRDHFPAVRIGRVWRFRKEHIDRWLQANGSQRAAARARRRSASARRSRKT